MKLLQVPTVNLEQRIKEELEANPALEEGAGPDDPTEVAREREEAYEEDNYDERDDRFELDEYLNQYMEDDPAGYKYRAGQYTADEEDKSIPVAVESSFHEYLEEQLGLLELRDETEEIIAHQIVGSIDSDGYLRRDLYAIMDDLMFSQNVFVEEKEIAAVLKKIQRFDPPGVGARDLRECLLIQLERKAEREKDLSLGEGVILYLAIDIIRDYFDEFSKKHFEKLQKSLDIEEEDLKEAIEQILKLNPKPASGFAGGGGLRNQYIVPDFIITNRDGELELSLNTRNAPDLRVSDQYREMLRAYKRNTKGRRPNKKEKEAVLFIKQKIDSARWFIDAIRQRQETMYKTMYAIMQYQYDYLLTGDTKKLRPMILKDIADITGLDISTISRVANSKYVQTEFGIKSLKDFFSESMQTTDGEEVSTREVKKILQEIIDAENKRKPLSDEKLKDLLQEQGYNIARRTVAKYREQLDIPVARLRKEL
jgi:RNA polymerase sigma-54 factor